MKIKMIDALQFPTVYQVLKTKTLPIKIAYALTKINAVVEKEQAYYREQLTAIIEQYAERDENGNPVTVDDGANIKIQQDKVAEAQTKVNELADIDVEVPEYQFSLDEFGGIELSPNELEALMPFIKE